MRYAWSLVVPLVVGLLVGLPADVLARGNQRSSYGHVPVMILIVALCYYMGKSGRASYRGPKYPRKPGPKGLLIAAAATVALAGCSGYRAGKANERGGACFDRKDFACAATEYGMAASLEPDVAKHRYNHGVSLAKGGLLDQGAMELREALRLDPTDLETSKALTVVQRAIERRQTSHLR